MHIVKLLKVKTIMECDNYIQKLSDISNSLSKLLDYAQSPEFKKAIEIHRKSLHY